MAHLHHDAMLAWAEGVRDPMAVAHLDACARCRDEAALLEAVLRDIRRVEVPEPSPLFWDHLSRRVRERVDAGERAPMSWLERARGWRWRPVLAALAPAAAIAVALSVAWPLLDRPAGVTPSPSVFDMPALTSDMDSEAWETVVDIAQAFDEEGDDSGPEVGLVPGSAERAVAELSAEEQQELERLLQAELGAI